MFPITQVFEVRNIDGDNANLMEKMEAVLRRFIDRSTFVNAI